MKTSISEALLLSIVMAVVIFFCRLFPFLFFRGKNNGTAGDNTTQESTTDIQDSYHAATRRGFDFLSFVEKTVPPVAMTVLTFNALAGPVQTDPRELIAALASAVFTALVHLWRRNPLISIFGGTALFMLLTRY